MGMKDQGQCGSCWAYSVTSEVESSHFMATGDLIELSTQQIISCDDEDDGCGGGDPVSAYQYLKNAKGLDNATDYPDMSSLSGDSETCTWNDRVSVRVSGFKWAVPSCTEGGCKHQDEDRLMRALLKHGPVSICVDAEDWDVYKGGIWKRACSSAADDLDHCVQLVGYDKSGKTPFWIIRNEWGQDWGIDGYMHLAMGRNLCGLADEATIAITDKGFLAAVEGSPEKPQGEAFISV